MDHKVFVLLSGGVDSTTTLAIAGKEFPADIIETVTIDYGQRHIREKECAHFQSVVYANISHTIDAKGLLTGMLVEKGAANEDIPNASYADLPKGISPTYVSFRNGTMLSLLAARAQSWIMDQQKVQPDEEFNATLYIGVHADDGVNWAYPDCTPEFIGAMANAIFVGTYNRVRLRAPLQYDNKIEVVAKGLRLGVNYQETWSCYRGEDAHCGTCPTCRSRKEAFEMNSVPDPTRYAA